MVLNYPVCMQYFYLRETHTCTCANNEQVSARDGLVHVYYCYNIACKFEKQNIGHVIYCTRTDIKL